MKHKIIIVEDNPAFTVELERNLTSWGHEIAGIFSYGEQFLERFGKIEATLLLFDVSLRGSLSGIEIASKIRDIAVPIIYMTRHNDMKTYDAAYRTNSIGFLVKPFDMLSLKSIIDSFVDGAQKDTKFLFFKKKRKLIKIRTSEIIYIHSDKNYCDIFVRDEVFTKKISATKLIEKLDNPSFVRIQKSYVVNIDLVDSISHRDSTLTIKRRVLPIGRKYKKEVIKRLSSGAIKKP